MICEAAAQSSIVFSQNEKPQIGFLLSLKDVELLISNYQKILSDFETNKGVVQSQKRKISEIDLSSNLNNLNPSDNKISINIDGRLYSVIFDEVNKNKAMKELSYKISQTTGFSSTFKDGVLKIFSLFL